MNISSYSNIFQLLKSVFLEEWNLLMTTEVTADMAIKFKLFGSKHTIRFTDLGVASVDIYASLGGKLFPLKLNIIRSKIVIWTDLRVPQ